jgi:hypothetical protein
LSAKVFAPLFPESDTPRIINEVLDCARKLTKKHATEREDKLTNRLYRMIIREKGYRAGPARQLCPQPQYDVFDFEGDNDDPIGRIDLVYVYGSLRDTYFAIEAKRLHVTFPSGYKTLAVEYVAKEQGMMCFISGKYSSAQRAGAMLGYVFDGAVGKARSEIKSAIFKHSVKLNLCAPSEFRKSKIVTCKERVDETHHDLGSRRFCIYHLLVSV